MENVFEEMLAEGTTDNSAEQGESVDHSFDLDVNDLFNDSTASSSEDTAEADDVNDDEGEGESNTPSELTNNAFAQMRVQNKEYSQKIAEVEALAKSLGLESIDDFIAKGKDAQAKMEAKKTGVPVEVAKELAEIRALKNDLIADRENAAKESKQRNFASNVNAFVESNKLSKAAVDKLSQDLEKDGLSVDMLMDIPKAALNKILSSYVGTDYQKNLERKNTIRKELPINQSSKIDNESLNKDLDNLAKQLAGKI